MRASTPATSALALACLALACLAPGCLAPPTPDDQSNEAAEADPESDPQSDHQSDPVAPASVAPANGLAAELAPPKTSPDPRLPGLLGDAAVQARLDAALAAKGDDYQPRTHHLHADGRPKYTNRLIAEASPYLLQHAHNPVNWFPWGDEVFARAEAEDKPVLLSIGYSTCHWCHVMERESFEDETIAAYINQNFYAIKVDREQRPDVDEIYMRAVQMMTGRGGWPMTVVLTPERMPFFAGTYFPPDDRGGRPGFASLLRRLADAYRESPDEVLARAQTTSRRLAEQWRGAAVGDDVPGVEHIAAAAETIGSRYDAEHGGFGSAPKFPRPCSLELLLRHAERSEGGQALAWVQGTVDAILAGGIHDHVGGGFHRYATDARWLVPHFEKMLYDNAQLAVVLLELHQITGEARYAEAARETLDYLDREMSAPGGGFFSATDADSPVPGASPSSSPNSSPATREGWFFTWTEAELDSVVGEPAASHLRAYYATRPQGNFEGRNILHTPRPLPDVADSLGLSVDALDRSLRASRAKLYEARLERPPPLRDDKVLSSWNGLAISAFARAAFVLDDPDYLARAERAAAFLDQHHRDPAGRLLRQTLDGEPGGPGFLDDYAFVIQGLLDLVQASGDLRWLELAVALQGDLDARFHDADAGGWFTTPDDGERLLARAKPIDDGAEPSGNAVATSNLLRLHALTHDARYRERGERALRTFADVLERHGSAVPKLLVALDRAWRPNLQIVVVTPPGEDPPAAAREVLAPVRRSFLPHASVLVIDEAAIAADAARVPNLAGKRARDGETTVYVCEDQACDRPTTDPEEVAAQLRARQSSAGGSH